MGAFSISSQRRLATGPRETDVAARLALAELLLATSDPVKCAQATVDWLGARGARRCLCTLIDARGKATAVVTYGIPKAQAGTLGMVLEEPVHPLLFALAGHQPKGPDRDYLAIPLPVSDKREARTGLLLVAPARTSDARWAATLLGQKLAKREEPLQAQFLANISHELRTPLNAILGYTSMLLAGVTGQMLPQQKQKLQRVEANGKILLAIVNDLLDLGRMDAGKMPLHAEEFDLPALIGELVQELPKTDLRLLVDLPQGPLPLLADRQRVKQILANLLANALKFTPAGSITVSLKLDRRDVRVEVADTGIGIALEDQEKIFEEFVQADDSVTREYGGAGLGLAICRRLANLLSGRIEVISELGKGSTFTLVVPRKGKRR
ncbi:MAG TPA: HAMP domain-containing sensor histidine kinase [Myxococcales bacterium]|nr:HAMP domain-containing sensor histidine kinase [Myxococcales bacterium]